MKISEKTIKALKILNVPMEEGLTAREFAEKMWADSDGWQRVKNQGHGATSGKGMWLCAGGYLSKLRAVGLIQPSWCKMTSRDNYTNFWRISDKGQKILERYNNTTVEWCIDYDRQGRCRAWDKELRPSGQTTGYCQVNKLVECDKSRMTKNTPLG